MSLSTHLAHPRVTTQGPAPARPQGRIRHTAAFILAAVMLLIGVAAPQASAQYTWKNVQIKGGGFVTGITMHPNAQNVIYARTDVGGAYRWNQSTGAWESISDGLNANENNYYGVDSLAIDPSDANKVYIAGGTYTQSWAGNAAILRSSDKGATWQVAPMSFKLGGNEAGRSNGERLAVDPNSGNTLLLGTRLNGVWKSTDAGATWSQISFPVTSTANNVGMTDIEFVQSSGSAGNPTPTIFIAVSQNSNNLYKTTNAGGSWAVVPGTPSGYIHHMTQDGLGNMYVTVCDDPGPSVGSGSVWKLNIASGGWTNVTPPTGQGGFGGVSVDKQSPTTIVVSTMARWWPNDVIYRSTNGGSSYTAILNSTTIDVSSAPWASSRNPHWIGDVEIDPFNSNRVMFITGYGVITSTNAAGASPTWAFTNNGLEETVPLGIISPPSGPNLLSALGDIGGFRHTNLDVSPPQSDYFATHRSTHQGIAFAQNNPSYIVRTFTEAPKGAYSTDGGLNWTDFASQPTTANTNGVGSIAVSADGARLVWWPKNSRPYYSTNNGASWTVANTGPIEPNDWHETGIKADTVNPLKFYAYQPALGQLYVSSDGGQTWAASAGAEPTDGNKPGVTPGYEGHLWLCAQWNSLRRTTDSGATWTSVAGWDVAYQVGFGRPASGQVYPAIYVFGARSGVSGIFRSYDNGSSWTLITDDAHEFGWINHITGDPRITGRVYITNGGRGIIYGDPSGQVLNPPAAPTNLAATAVSTSQINLNWTDNANNETGFVIDRATNSSFTSGLVTSTVGTNVISFSATGLVASTTYYFRVRATNADGDSGNSNTASATTQSGGVTVPAAPSNLSGTAVSTSQINLSWSDNSNNESGFLIERATDSSFTSGFASASVGSNVTGYSATGLAKNTRYYFRVKATNGAGDSGYSNTISVRTNRR